MVEAEGLSKKKWASGGGKSAKTRKTAVSSVQNLFPHSASVVKYLQEAAGSPAVDFYDTRQGDGR